MNERLKEVTHYLNVHRAHSPSWSADGKLLAFVTNISGIDQAWVLPVAEQEPKQLTRFRNRVGQIAWSPTDNYLLVTSDTGGNEHDQLYLLSLSDDELRPLTDLSDVIHGFGTWSPDGRCISYSCNQRHPAFFDVYIMDVSSGDISCILQQDTTLVPEAWSPDGTMLIVSRANSLLDNDLFLVQIDGSTPLLLTPHESEAAYKAPCWAPDGQALYVLTNFNREFLAPAIFDITAKGANSGEHVPMRYLMDTAWDADDGAGLSLSPDGNVLAYALNEDGKSHLILYHIKVGKALCSPSLPGGVISGLTWAPDGTKLAFEFNGPRNGSNIWIASATEEKVYPITAIVLNEPDPSTLVEPELIHYKSFDGLHIPAYYYRPLQDFRTTAAGTPTIVFVHGGPEAQFRPVHTAPWILPIQYYLQLGFAVFATNVRGSTGYGKTFTHLDDVRLRMDSVADLKWGVQWLVSHGGADPRRIGIIGRSYGGFMVLTALITYPDLWAAGVNIVGIANFVTFLENTGSWRRKLREIEYGSLENDREFLKQISPIHSIDRIASPLFVVHGANDPRVPINEAEQLVKALRTYNIPVKYLRYEDEGHYVQHQSSQIEMYSAIGNWFERYMK